MVACAVMVGLNCHDARATAPQRRVAKRAADVRFLLPSPSPVGLRLTAAQLRDVVDAPPCMGSCAQSVPIIPMGWLVYQSAESPWISVSLTQLIVGRDSTKILRLRESKSQRIGHRDVQMSNNVSDVVGLYWAAEWRESDGSTVSLRSRSLALNEVVEFIQSLRPANAATWAVLRPAPLGAPCVGPTTQYAPSSIPDGWKQSVLQARPSGACGPRPFLMLLLARPIEPNGPPDDA